MPKRSKRLKKKIESLEKQKKKHETLIEEHKDVKGKQHTIGYWAKEIQRFEKQIDEGWKILRRKKRSR